MSGQQTRRGTEPILTSGALLAGCLLPSPFTEPLTAAYPSATCCYHLSQHLNEVGAVLSVAQKGTEA